jgi:hypothetical protein
MRELLRGYCVWNVPQQLLPEDNLSTAAQPVHFMPVLLASNYFAFSVAASLHVILFHSQH